MSTYFVEPIDQYNQAADFWRHQDLPSSTYLCYLKFEQFECHYFCISKEIFKNLGLVHNNLKQASQLSEKNI